jgi:tumor protein p53-inducible protein 3
MGGADINGPLLRTLMSKRIQLLATTLRTRSVAYKAALVAAFSANALPLFAQDPAEAGPASLQVLVDSRFAFADAAAAHAHVESNANAGKVLLVFP